jgi:hypothetical protein
VLIRANGVTAAKVVRNEPVLHSKTDLRDLTFVVPFCLDLPERIRNLRIISEFIVSRFDTVLTIAEYDAEPTLSLHGWPEELRRRVRHRFFPNPHRYFQRSRAINLAAREVETPFFAIYDADVLLERWQYEAGARLLRDGACDACLPFANRVMWIPRDDVPAIESRLDDRTLASLDHEISDESYRFVGLVNLFDTRAFFETGMMNENLRSWGYDDVELHDRLVKLGYRVLRTGGLAYHLGHGNGGDTGPHHPHFWENSGEYYRIVGMTPEQLRGEVESWPWAKDETAPPPARRGRGPRA